MRIVRKRKECNKWRGNIGPNIWKITEKNSVIVLKCVVRFNGEVEYEIDLVEDPFIVYLRNMTCKYMSYLEEGLIILVSHVHMSFVQ